MLGLSMHQPVREANNCVERVRPKLECHTCHVAKHEPKRKFIVLRLPSVLLFLRRLGGNLSDSKRCVILLQLWSSGTMWSKRNDLVDYKIPEQRLNISFIFSPNLYRHPRGIETMNPLVFMIVRSAPAPPPPPLPGPIAAAIIEALTSVVLAISRGVDTTFGLPQLKVPLTIDPAAQDGVVASNSLLSTAWNVVSEHFSPSLISNQPRYMVAVNSNVCNLCHPSYLTNDELGICPPRCRFRHPGLMGSHGSLHRYYIRSRCLEI